MRIDVTGQTFGDNHQFTVLRRIEGRPKQSAWECQCRCGTIHIVYWRRVSRGNYPCCSCTPGNVPAHRRPEYYVWRTMTARCSNENHKKYKNYGGRGITVCRRWKDSFISFFSDMGERPTKKHQIDRINNDWGYWCGKCPDCRQREIVECNCRWVTPKENMRNTRLNHLVTFNEKTLCVREWEERLGFPIEVIQQRLKLGWTVERALATPPRVRVMILEFNGKRKTIVEWAKEIGLNPMTISGRLRRGWTVEAAITTPSRGINNQ